MRYYGFLVHLMSHYEVRKLQNYGKSSDRSVCLLRHDIDWDFELFAALRMAEIECNLGIQSSYYLIPSVVWKRGLYFRSGTSALEAGLNLQDMGHEVGLHNNVLVACIKSGDSFKKILERELSLLRESGITTYGTSAHGDPLCWKGDIFTNYEIFKQCVSPYRQENTLQIDGKKWALHTLDLNDYGLYEAYFLPRDYYITYRGNSWRYTREGDEWNPRFREDTSKITDILKFVKNISKSKIVMQMNLHPGLFVYD